jgi:hypothetical protein
MGRKKRKERDEWIVKLQDEFYTHMDDKRKWKDMRQYTNSYKKMQEGHLLKFKNTERKGLPLLYRLIQKKTIHGPGPGSLRSVFDNEELEDIIPGFKGTFEDFKDLYYSFGYSVKKTEKEGVVVFSLELEPDSDSDSDSLSKTSVVSVSPSPDEGGVGPELVVDGRKMKRKGRGKGKRRGSRQSIAKRKRQRRTRVCQTVNEEEEGGYTTTSRVKYIEFNVQCQTLSSLIHPYTHNVIGETQELYHRRTTNVSTRCLVSLSC